MNKLIEVGPIKKKVSGLLASRLRPARRHFFLFLSCCFFAMKRCPIAAKIAGSNGILPGCVLNDFVLYIGVRTFARYVQPLLATILCHTVNKKKPSQFRAVAWACYVFQVVEGQA